MKIAEAPVILYSAQARREAAGVLASGKPVVVQAATSSGDLLHQVDFESMKKDIEAGRAAVTQITWDSSYASKVQINVPGMVVGGATGSVAGAAVGVLLNQLRTVHPTSSVAVDAACALLGTSLGAAVGSGLFGLKLTWGKDGPELEVSAASHKA